MPASYPDDIVEEAKKLYQDGRSPSAIAVIFHLKGGRYASFHRSTVAIWAKRYGWGSWREAKTHKPDRADPAQPFAISGITDPIYHLACVKARQFARKSVDDNWGMSVSQVVVGTLLHVAGELDPGSRVYSALYPVIRDEVRKIRREIRADAAYARSPDAQKDVATWRKDNPGREQS